MKEMVPKILDGSKIITNRAYSKFRAKCNEGDIMHLFTEMRTSQCEKIGDALVLEQEYWEFQEIPFENQIDYKVAPIRTMNWELFIKMDGFDNYQDFRNYFNKERYRDGILCYRFQLLSKK